MQEKRISCPQLPTYRFGRRNLLIWYDNWAWNLCCLNQHTTVPEWKIMRYMNQFHYISLSITLNNMYQVKWTTIPSGWVRDRWLSSEIITIPNILLRILVIANQIMHLLWGHSICQKYWLKISWWLVPSRVSDNTVVWYETANGNSAQAKGFIFRFETDCPSENPKSPASEHHLTRQ
jgi:hypothetical protein